MPCCDWDADAEALASCATATAAVGPPSTTPTSAAPANMAAIRRAGVRSAVGRDVVSGAACGDGLVMVSWAGGVDPSTTHELRGKLHDEASADATRSGDATPAIVRCPS